MTFIPLSLPVDPGSLTFVLDAGVATAWGTPSIRNYYVSDVLARMPFSVAVVPGHWFLQVAELIRGAVTAKILTAASASYFLVGLNSLSIRYDTETSTYVGDTFNLAQTHNVAVFAAAYLELALRLNLPLATTDATLLRVAGAAGVPIFTP